MAKRNIVKQPLEHTGVAKVPIIMQMEALECGAACLDMVLAYYEKWVPLEQMRVDCGISRDGSNAVNLLKAARHYHLDAKGYRLEPEQLKEHGSFPCIVHWNFNHFVVLCGFRGNKAVLADPARGSVTVDMDEFDSSFTGIVLMFHPEAGFETGGKKRSMLSFAKQRLKGTAGAIVFVLLTTVLTSIIGILNPAFSRIFMDRLLTGQNADWFYPFIIAMSAMVLIQILVSIVTTLYQLKIEGKLAIVANSTYMWHILRLPMEFYSQRMAGDISMRQSLNESIASSLINIFAPLLLDFVMLILYLTVMVRYSVLLTCVGVASIVLNLLMAQLISNQRVNLSRVQMRDAGNLISTTMSGVEMIETIKASGAENGFFEKWSGYQAAVNTQNVKTSKLNEYLGSVPELVTQLADMAILVLGVYLTMQGKFTIGMILAFQGFMQSFMDPAMSLIGAGQSLMEMRTNMERVEDVMNYKTDVEYDNSQLSEAVSYDKLTGVVELKNVTFGYSPLGDPLVENFSMSLKNGSRVAFVGASGSGKSTIAKLISGLYQPWSGEILFDGKPIKDIRREVFTGSLAVVDQNIILFEDTVRNNIKMWDDSIEDYEMIMAARDAQIHEDIMKRDGGYDAQVISGGRDFSGGQRQRLEIARVLAQDPTIVILDEATSALDAKTEFDVVNSIRARGITCIVVAHRLSTIRDCDEIIVLEHGKVVDRGTHEELYARGGLYADLVSNE